MALKIFSFYLKICVLELLRGRKRGVLLCGREESPYNLINVLGPFISPVATIQFLKSPDKTASKIAKMVQYFGFQLNI